jgi:TM2 domain-containing membrane protein YozV
MQKIYKDSNIAAILALIIPGSGYMYSGRIGLGIIMFFLIPILYLCGIIPGIIVHIVTIFDAVREVKKFNR